MKRWWKPRESNTEQIAGQLEDVADHLELVTIEVRERINQIQRSREAAGLTRNEGDAHDERRRR